MKRLARSFRITAALAVIFLAATGFGERSAGERTIQPAASWQPPDGSALLQYRIMKILELEERRHPPGQNDPVFAPTCVSAPTLSDFLDLKDIQTRGTASLATVLPDLNAPATSIGDVFKVIRASRWGNAVMNKFSPKFGFDIKIGQFTGEMAAAEQRRGRRAAAVYDVDQKKIFFDKNARIGTVAPILLHEIIHSLDGDFARSVERERDLWKSFDREVNDILKATSARTGKNEDELQDTDFTRDDLARMVKRKTQVEQFRDIRVYRAERIAYDMYYYVIRDLAALFPHYYQSGNIRPFDDAELIRIEGLSPDTIDKYKRGLCETK